MSYDVLFNIHTWNFENVASRASCKEQLRHGVWNCKSDKLVPGSDAEGLGRKEKVGEDILHGTLGKY
jgi:hypothetical protein